MRLAFIPPLFRIWSSSSQSEKLHSGFQIVLAPNGFTLLTCRDLRNSRKYYPDTTEAFYKVQSTLKSDRMSFSWFVQMDRAGTAPTSSGLASSRNLLRLPLKSHDRHDVRYWPEMISRMKCCPILFAEVLLAFEGSFSVDRFIKGRPHSGLFNSFLCEHRRGRGQPRERCARAVCTSCA